MRRRGEHHRIRAAREALLRREEGRMVGDEALRPERHRLLDHGLRGVDGEQHPLDGELFSRRPRIHQEPRVVPVLRELERRERFERGEQRPERKTHGSPGVERAPEGRSETGERRMRRADPLRPAASMRGPGGAGLVRGPDRGKLSPFLGG